MNRESFLKGLIIMFLYLIGLKMNKKKGRIIDQKEFLDLKYLFVSRIGGYPPPPPLQKIILPNNP